MPLDAVRWTEGFWADRFATARDVTLPWLLELAEDFVSTVVTRVLDRCRAELEFLERDLTKLEAIRAPFPRLTYAEAAEILTTPEARAAMAEAERLERRRVRRERGPEPGALDQLRAGVSASAAHEFEHGHHGVQ